MNYDGPMRYIFLLVVVILAAPAFGQYASSPQRLIYDGAAAPAAGITVWDNFGEQVYQSVSTIMDFPTETLITSVKVAVQIWPPPRQGDPRYPLHTDRVAYLDIFSVGVAADGRPTPGNLEASTLSIYDFELGAFWIRPEFRVGRILNGQYFFTFRFDSVPDQGGFLSGNFQSVSIGIAAGVLIDSNRIIYLGELDGTTTEFVFTPFIQLSGALAIDLYTFDSPPIPEPGTAAIPLLVSAIAMSRPPRYSRFQVTRR